MNANIDFIKDITERFSSLEYELEKKLKTIEATESKFEELNASDGSSMSNELNLCPSSLEDAKKRNRKIVEDMEQARAHLRSRVIYSPLEAILEKSQINYFRIGDTPSKKRYGPVFV